MQKLFTNVFEPWVHVLCVIACLFVLSISAEAQDKTHQGVVVSCYRWGPGEWDGPGMEPLLDELLGLGVDAVQIHPYASIDRDGTVGYRRDQVAPATLKPLGWAKERGMKTFLKPHLSYWRSGFAWRGAITFKTDAQWERFFRGYTVFIEHQASLAEQAGADVFAVGTELRLSMHREADWRRLIERVRKVYTGKITYAANWDDHDKVLFWDALDLIGVQCYYPVSKVRPPAEEDLVAGWETIRKKLRAVSQKHSKPVLLTELGYAVSEAAAAEPWAHQAVGDEALGQALKLRCMRVALNQLKQEPAIAGIYLWKWFPGGRDHSHDFTLQYDAMREVVRQAWGG